MPMTENSPNIRWIQFKEQGSTPATPDPTYDRLYFKSDGLYYVTPGGVEIRLASAAAFSAQTANTVLAGPTTAGPTVPTFRALVAADITSALTTALTTPPAIGGTTPAAGTFTTLTNTGAAISKTRVHTAAGAVTVAADDHIVVVNKTVGAATTVNLPGSPAPGRTLIIKDGKGDAATNNITLTPAAGNIDGAATFVMNVNYSSITLVYNGTTWNII